MDERRAATGAPTAQTGPEPRQSTPRWVKGFIVAAAIIATIVVVALVQRGDHGPGRHEPDSQPASTTAPAEHQPPANHDG